MSEEVKAMRTLYEFISGGLFLEDTPKDEHFDFSFDVTEIRYIGANECFITCLYYQDPVNIKNLMINLMVKDPEVKAKLKPNRSIRGVVRVYDQHRAELIKITEFSDVVLYPFLRCSFCGNIQRVPHDTKNIYKCPLCGAFMNSCDNIYKKDKYGEFTKKYPLS